MLVIIFVCGSLVTVYHKLLHKNRVKNSVPDKLASLHNATGSICIENSVTMNFNIEWLEE